jgi:predicted RNase H-like nuclease
MPTKELNLSFKIKKKLDNIQYINDTKELFEEQRDIDQLICEHPDFRALVNGAHPEGIGAIYYKETLDEIKRMRNALISCSTDGDLVLPSKSTPHIPNQNRERSR